MTDASELAMVVMELERRKSARFGQYFTADGPYARDKYPKHMEFFSSGAMFKERLFMAANRVGKSEGGAYEVTCHLTGRYPDWWTGRRFAEPVEVWACGTTSETTRDIVQTKLFGPADRVGQWTGGMMPPNLIVKHSRRPHGLPNSLESVWIKHVSGGTSVVGLKTYEQGRKSFEGTAKHVIWCDEEPPADCYTEMLYRTLTTQGIVLVTFTPLQGMSEVVMGFLEPTEEAAAHKHYIQAGWRDVPHLSETDKAALIATTPPYQIKARTEGEPVLGSGAIYPINEDDLIVPTRAIPDTWRKVYGMDVGWNRTAAIFAAQDPSTGGFELYAEHYVGQGEPASHALAIKAHGAWMKGVIDPASVASSQKDGEKLIEVYRKPELGLNLYVAENTVEAGLMAVWNLMITGRLKVQAHLANWLREFRKYHRDEKGKIVKANDHLMDATRYLVVSGTPFLSIPPQPKRTHFAPHAQTSGPMAWAGN
jgi:phage terminase large subunit-like protein